MNTFRKVSLVKLHNNENKKSFLTICFFQVPLLFCSCGGGSVTTLPEAPPPYPNFPVPYQPPGTQPVSTGASLENQKNVYQSNLYAPNQYKRPETGQYNSWESSPNALSPAPNYARFTVHAKANLWLLIQDANGNELDWLKLQENEKIPISHIGALTITCSSGQDIEIFNKEGRKINTPGSNKPGISIIRLN